MEVITHDSNGEKPKKSVRYKRPAMALYGNVAIPKGFCRKCGSTSFIRDGFFVCCGAPVKGEPGKFYRESEAPQQRKKPPKSEQERILAEQGHRCFYCEVPFDSTRFRKGKPVRIHVHWDHQLPFAYSQNNKSSNFVAACHVCNGIKSDFVFRDLQEAQVYLAGKRKQKGYDF